MNLGIKGLKKIKVDGRAKSILENVSQHLYPLKNWTTALREQGGKELYKTPRLCILDDGLICAICGTFMAKGTRVYFITTSTGNWTCSPECQTLGILGKLEDYKSFKGREDFKTKKK